jgi:glycerol uptake facilitator-like aquaporin
MNESFTLPRRLLAEGLGTALLLATVVGSGIMAERLAGGNVALALLGNTIPTGAILFVLITMLGPISGAHFNPVVTLSFLLRREVGLVIALYYMAVQVTGGVLGTFAAHAMFEVEIVQFSSRSRTGMSQWLSEGIATFGLVGTILATLRFKPEATAMAVALFITAAYWFAASTSFANPAVTIARSLTDSFSGISPGDIYGFIIAQVAGALIATLLMAWLLKTRAHH